MDKDGVEWGGKVGGVLVTARDDAADDKTPKGQDDVCVCVSVW
jgi:hypothetical protein